MIVGAINSQYEAVPRTILIQALNNTPLLGMDLLVGYDLRMRVEIGGVVRIEAVP